jgi:hypothetical protein
MIPKIETFLDDQLLRLKFCPDCSYDLRGQPRTEYCPECGSQYDEHTFDIIGRAYAAKRWALHELGTAIAIMAFGALLMGSGWLHGGLFRMAAGGALLLFSLWASATFIWMMRYRQPIAHRVQVVVEQLGLRCPQFKPMGLLLEWKHDTVIKLDQLSDHLWRLRIDWPHGRVTTESQFPERTLVDMCLAMNRRQVTVVTQELQRRIADAPIATIEPTNAEPSEPGQ